MMWRTHRALFPLSLALAAGTLATVVPGLSLEQLTDLSETIVAGNIVRSWSAWDAPHQHIWTHYEIAVTGTYKGAASANASAAAGTITVSEPGGTVGGQTMSIAGAVSYTSGESVILFLQRMPNGYLRTTGWAQGKFSVDRSGLVHPAGASRGLEIIRPDGAAPAAAAAPSTPLRALDSLTAAQLRSRVEARLRATAAKGAR